MTGPAWLVLPTFNEAENLETVVAAARRVLGEAAPEGFRVLVVDDDSPDGTGAMADELAAAHPGEVEVLHRPVREGLGPAYLAGFGRALSGGAGHVVEVPIVFRDRELGTSKMSWQITAEAAWLVPQLRRGAEHLRHSAGGAQGAPSSRRIDTG